MQSGIQKTFNRSSSKASRVGKALIILGLIVYIVPFIFMGIDWLLMWSRMLSVIQTLPNPPASQAPMPTGYMSGAAHWLELEIFPGGPIGTLMVIAGAITMNVARRRMVAPIPESINPTGSSHS